jgi:hypothetical protein
MMSEIFTLTYSPLATFERFLILALVTVAILWLYCVARCYFADKGKTPLKVIISRSLIEASLICIVFLAVYFVFFVKATGWQRFVWDEWYWSFSRNTYLMLLPEILILVFVSIFFFIQTNKLSNILKSK